MERGLHLQPMDMKEISKWVSMPYWSTLEAITLSMGVYDEDAKELDITPEEARAQHKEYESRVKILQRAEQMGQIKIHLIEDLNSNLPGKTVAIDPVDFISWAADNLPSISAELCNEVKKRHNTKKQKTAKDEKTGNPGSDARWIIKHTIVKTAENYVKKSLKDGCVYCDHCQLADFMYNNAIDENGKLLFDYPDLDENILMNYLKDGAKNALNKLPTRIVGNKGYKKSEGNCEIHPVKHKDTSPK